MRRWLLLAGATVGAVAAFGVFSPLATVSANVAFSISGSVVGGVTHASVGDQVTFVFKEQNTGTSSAERFMVLQPLTNATLQDLSCVVQGGLFNPDGNNCEPGSLRSGQTAFAIVTVTLTGGPSASAKECLQNPANAALGPCKTLSVTS